jgi:hypothetical protein
LGISQGELDKAKEFIEQHNQVDKKEADTLQILTLRFSSDRICPPERIRRLRKEFGKNLCEICIQSPNPIWGIAEDAHAVLTGEYRAFPEIHPTRKAFAIVMRYLDSQLKPVKSGDPKWTCPATKTITL